MNDFSLEFPRVGDKKRGVIFAVSFACRNLDRLHGTNALSSRITHSPFYSSEFREKRFHLSIELIDTILDDGRIFVFIAMEMREESMFCVFSEKRSDLIAFKFKVDVRHLTKGVRDVGHASILQKPINSSRVNEKWPSGKESC